MPALVDGKCPLCGNDSYWANQWGSCGCDLPDEWENRVEQKPFTPYFDQAFGCVVRSPGHKRRLLKQHGLVEAGGELEKHVFGKDLRPPDRPIATRDEFEKKLAEVREKMRDPEYRRRYEVKR